MVHPPVTAGGTCPHIIYSRTEGLGCDRAGKQMNTMRQSPEVAKSWPKPRLCEPGFGWVPGGLRGPCTKR